MHQSEELLKYLGSWFVLSNQEIHQSNTFPTIQPEDLLLAWDCDLATPKKCN